MQYIIVVLALLFATVISQLLGNLAANQLDKLLNDYPTFRFLRRWSKFALLLILFILFSYLSFFFIPSVNNTFNQHPSYLTFNQLIPFDVGWIFIGYVDEQQKYYVEGPTANVRYRPNSGNRGALVPLLGDILQIRKERNIVVANYKIQKLTNQLTSPPLIKGVLDDNDYTGIKIPKGELVIVRDVTLTHFEGRPFAVWCLIAECNPDDDSCLKAAAEIQLETN